MLKGFDVRWENEAQSILMIEIGASWTWNDFTEAEDAARRLLATASDRVDCIIDASRPFIPENFLRNFSRVAASPAFTHPAVELVFYVTSSRMMRMLVTIFIRVYPHLRRKLRIVRTNEVACQMITREQMMQSVP